MWNKAPVRCWECTHQIPFEVDFFLQGICVVFNLFILGKLADVWVFCLVLPLPGFGISAVSLAAQPARSLCRSCNGGFLLAEASKEQPAQILVRAQKLIPFSFRISSLSQ